jgi:hypothetical protein
MIIVCTTFLWMQILRPFFVGVFSCFRDCLASCSCGWLHNCSVGKIFAVCNVYFAADVPNYPAELVKEKKLAKRLIKRAKDLEPKLGRLDLFAEKRVEDRRRALEKELARVNDEITSVDDVQYEDIEAIREMMSSLEDEIRGAIDIASWQEQAIMLTFMFVFVLMLIALTRGDDVYYQSKANTDTLLKEPWVQTDPLHSRGFKEINSMEEVGRWGSVLIDTLYDDVKCNIAGTFAEGSCRPEWENQTTVQRVNDWNIGFMNTTFVRVTVQPSCYIPNEQDRFVGGAPYLWSSTGGENCVFNDCFQKALEKDGVCRNSQGEQLLTASLPFYQGFTTAPEHYNYSIPGKLGPYGLHGGITVSLGRTKSEAQYMLKALQNDLWFTKNSAA